MSFLNVLALGGVLHNGEGESEEGWEWRVLIAKEEQNEHQRKKDQRKQSGKARGMSRTNDKSLRAAGS